MTNFEKLQRIQEIKDDAFTVYEAMRIQNGNTYQYIQLMQKMIQKIDNLAYSASSKAEIPNGVAIVVEDDYVIEPGQMIEIHTNLTDYPEDIRENLIFKGYLPSEGYIGIEPQYWKTSGMVFNIQNVVPRAILKNYGKDRHYQYNSINQIKYIDNGIYRIPRGTEIGFAILKEPVKQEDSSKRELKLIDISKKKDE